MECIWLVTVPEERSALLLKAVTVRSALQRPLAVSQISVLVGAARSGAGTAAGGAQPRSLSVFRRDLCTAFGKDVLKLVEARPMIHELLTEGRRSKTNKTKTLATWATKELRKLKNQAW